MKILCSASVCLFALSFTMNATVYTVNQTVVDNEYNPGQLGYVTGTITTDGAIGVLSASDITGWNLTLTTSATDVLKNTDSNAALVVSGTDVTASANDLFFNFSGTSGFLLFQDNLYSGTQYNCYSVGYSACFSGESVIPEVYYDSTSRINTALSGNQIIASTATPEPGLYGVLGLGLAGLVGAVRRRNAQKA